MIARERLKEKSKEEFYTQKRWTNWMNKVKESKFELTDSEQDATGAVFVYIMDDVVLACLKVIARKEKNLITQEEAFAALRIIQEIVSSEHESLGQDADMMLESLQTALFAVFISCQRYLEGDYDQQTRLADLVEQARQAEGEERIDDCLGLVGSLGARVIGGEKLPELPEMPYSMVAELMDGVDAIAAAMMGDDSYKEEDGSDLGDEA